MVNHKTKSRPQTCRGRRVSVKLVKEIMESPKMSLNVGAQTAQHQPSLKSEVSSSLPSFIVAICKIKFTLETTKKMKKCEQPEAQVPHCHCKLPLSMNLVQNLQQLEVSFTTATSDNLMPDLATAQIRLSWNNNTMNSNGQTKTRFLQKEMLMSQNHITITPLGRKEGPSKKDCSVPPDVARTTISGNVHLSVVP